MRSASEEVAGERESPARIAGSGGSSGRRHAMKQLARTSLVVMLLLSSVGTAFAECAWVLWQEGSYVAKGSSEIDTRWYTLSAWNDLRTCEVARQERLAGFPKGSQTLEPGSVLVTWDNGATTTFRPICLPDTVDPRPKSGTR
jgi:hypothetical protein